MGGIATAPATAMRLRAAMTALLIATTTMAVGDGAATARPLEASPSDLAWAAWLRQHDEQPQNQLPPPPPPPRRITTKSLFVFPHLPDCAEGYRPDSLGRCVKVVRLDESAHLDFLLQKLNSKFGATQQTHSTAASDEDDLYDYDQDDGGQNSGPLQLSIPLSLGTGGSSSSEEGGSGDLVVVSVAKKEAATSSPEFVPQDVQTEPRPIPTSANGKFENFTCDSCTTTEEGTTMTPTTTTFPTEETTLADRGLVILPNEDSGDSPLVEEIEALKNGDGDDDDDDDATTTTEQTTPTTEADMTTTTITTTDRLVDLDPALSDIAQEALNIEDKIRVISRFADVVVDDATRNNHHHQHQQQQHHHHHHQYEQLPQPQQQQLLQQQLLQQHQQRRPPPDPRDPFADIGPPPWWDGQGWGSSSEEVQSRFRPHQQGPPGDGGSPNLRHGASGHRRGKPLVYTRDRHPHYREAI